MHGQHSSSPLPVPPSSVQWPASGLHACCRLCWMAGLPPMWRDRDFAGHNCGRNGHTHPRQGTLLTTPLLALALSRGVVNCTYTWRVVRTAHHRRGHTTGPKIVIKMVVYARHPSTSWHFQLSATALPPPPGDSISNGFSHGTEVRKAYVVARVVSAGPATGLDSA